MSGSSGSKRDDLIAGCAGGLFVLLFLEILAGALLETRYSATAAFAYRDVHAMQTGGLALIRALHYWSSALLIAGSFALLVWMAFLRWFAGAFNRMWLAVGLLFLASLVGQITGNVLPFDRHGVQTAVIESGIAARMPVAGGTVAGIMLSGSQFNDSTVGSWHVAHVGILVLGLAAIVLFWLGSRGQAKNMLCLGAPVVLALGAACAAHAPLGSAATSTDYGSFDAQVSWYTWPLHGSLNLFAKVSPALAWIGSGLIPSLFALVIVAAPLLGRRMGAKAVQRIFLGFAAYFIVAAVSFGGRFAPLVGDRDPAIASATRVTAVPKVDPVLYSKGRQLFNSNACQGCHGTDGLDGTEGGGPNLRGVSKKRGTDPAWYVNFIKDPASVKPNTTMPAFPELSEGDRRAMAEFLIHQK